jgi:predicted short-subunit dehydrogenase-like oxidoreductase (DUF2520 family)
VNVALIGAGSVGTGAASLLQRAGHRIVAVAPQERESSRRAAEALGTQATDLRTAANAADVILIGAPDRAIEGVARVIGPVLDRDAIACHFAGSLGRKLLPGTARAAIHPVQSCPDAATAIRRLPGSYWGVTCDDAATDRVVAMIEEDMSGKVVFVEEKDRPIWHAATVITANGISALLALGERMLGEIEVADPVGVLGPLASGAVSNAGEQGGGGKTLTGPVVRGDVETIRGHLRALERSAPDCLLGYRRAAAVVLTAAQQSGRVDEVLAARIRDLLERP